MPPMMCGWLEVGCRCQQEVVVAGGVETGDRHLRHKEVISCEG